MLKKVLPGPATKASAAIAGGIDSAELSQAVAKAVPAPVRRPRPATLGQGKPWVNFDPTDGALRVVSPAPGDGYDLFIDGQFAGAHFAKAGSITVSKVNRLIGAEASATENNWWTVTRGNALPVPRNFKDEWTLEGVATLYLTGPRMMTATYKCPVEGSILSVVPGQAYVFEALLALHRAGGTVRLTFYDDGGERVDVVESAIPEGYRGGPKAKDYAEFVLKVTAPPAATGLRIEIEKGETIGEKGGFLFFARHALYRASQAGGVTGTAHLPPEVILDLFREPGAEFHICNIPIPGECIDSPGHRLTIQDRATGELLTETPILVQMALKAVAQIHGIEGSALSARVILPPRPISGFTLSLWVDGEPLSHVVHDPANKGQLRIPLPVAVCDGRPHIFELRLGQTGKLLASYAGLGPMQSTPWEALRLYSGRPLPHHLAPAARNRYTSFADAGNAATAVPLAQLHDILAEGFANPRSRFRVLPFTAAGNPEVSIVIPVHNKFDVTYNCLAAVLFAATDASFEVIVVDDGSSDTTLRLAEIAPGVRIVRRAKARGFVGACNAGAETARGEFIVLLNNDTEPTARWLDELIYALRNFDNAGMAGSKLLFADGRLQDAGGIVWESGNPWNYGRSGNPHDPRYSYSRICDYLSGAAIAIPAALWRQLGGLSAEFAPAYFEDTDLAFKVRQAGKHVVFAAKSIVVHHEGLSNGTDASSVSELKRFQEINRPKFKRKWAKLFSGNGKEGVDADRVKDRGVSRRVVFFDAEIPQIDRDAGSYAAIQEIRMFQALGCKVTFVPLNFAYIAGHTDYLQRIGVEVIHLPFHSNAAEFLKARGSEFDFVYITRYAVADRVVEACRRYAPDARIALNVADLHFLRAIREAMATSSAERFDDAVKMREAELAALGKVDLVLTYSHVEQAVITSHLPQGPRTAILPWVIDAMSAIPGFAERRDVAFIGGFRHPPNVNAVKYFVNDIMPLLRQAVPGIRFLVYGSKAPKDIEDLASEDVIVKGYVKDVSEVFSTCRVFVAPLLFGAGMKGKVLDCIAAGVPSVLSPDAAEGIGLRAGLDAIVANSPEGWVSAIVRLHENEAEWTAMSENVRAFASSNFSFAEGIASLRDSLDKVGLTVFEDRPVLYVSGTRAVPPWQMDRREDPGARWVEAQS